MPDDDGTGSSAGSSPSDWFSPRESRDILGNPPPEQPPLPEQPGEAPEWFTPRQSGSHPTYGAGGFTGASDPSGYGPPRDSDPYSQGSGAYPGDSGTHSSGFGPYQDDSDPRSGGYPGGSGAHPAESGPYSTGANPYSGGSGAYPGSSGSAGSGGYPGDAGSGAYPGGSGSGSYPGGTDSGAYPGGTGSGSYPAEPGPYSTGPGSSRRSGPHPSGSGAYSQDPGAGSRAGGSGAYSSGSGAYGAGAGSRPGGSGSRPSGSGAYSGGSGSRPLTMPVGPGSRPDSGLEQGRRRKRSAGSLVGPMAGAVGLVLLLGVGVYAFAATSGGCSDDDAITLSVAAAPELSAVISQSAADFNGAKHKVDGRCVTARVRSAAPVSVTTLLSGQGSSGDTSQRPDVWIPDSSLWTSMVRTSERGKNAVQPTRTSLAQSPLVVGMPQSLAAQLRRAGVIGNPSWDNLLKAAGGTAGGAVTKNQMIPPNLVRLYMADPTRNAAGIGTLALTNILLTNDPNRDAIFTGMVRTVRENITPSVQAQYTSLKRDRQGRYPVIITPEQAVHAYNSKKPAEPAVAVYPQEGTLSMDYPYTVTTADPAKKEAARLLESALNGEKTRNLVRAQGFRTSDGKAPSTFGAATGVSPQRPRQLPTPQPADVQKIMQSWSRLSLSIRMLTLTDISGSMAEEVGPGVTRLEATQRIAQGGLSLMPNDSELGTWEFSTRLKGNQDWIERVPIGPLGERIGSATRRQLILSSMAQSRPKPNGDTGLYDSVVAAYKYMKKTYKPEMGNSILLFTDGKNDDDQSLTLKQTLDTLKRELDPTRPVQVIMIGFGPGVDRNELEQIAKATKGSVHIAQKPEDIQKIFLQALSRRVAGS
ncbi:hypothetical protein DPM19_28295 [Actinomadura craniellae]|uniref:VWFA domain-containing protein n=1 Tax=Actinomadura craniellae TaxID=2231787 RepID=A0A365GYF9_9ACTN|nr:substrate-binding and VWA domain-containing protein [Actinomadura craniellae]RAY11875.1 hypothetical protein DPM19_28295 [Actinomadura craniellae]